MATAVSILLGPEVFTIYCKTVVSFTALYFQVLESVKWQVSVRSKLGVQCSDTRVHAEAPCSRSNARVIWSFCLHADYECM